MTSAAPNIRLGRFLPAPSEPSCEVLYSYDAPLIWLDRSASPGSVLLFFAVGPRADGPDLYRLAELTETEARAIAEGDADLRDPFLGRESPLAAWDDEDGLRVIEISVPDPERDLPDEFVTLSRPKTLEKGEIAGIREGFRAALSGPLDAVKGALRGHAWVAEGRGGYAYDDPGYARELTHMGESAREALDRLDALLARGRDRVSRNSALAQPLRAEISALAEASADARAAVEAVTAFTAQPEDRAVQVRARLFCQAMAQVGDALRARVADRTQCPRTDAEIREARAAFSDDAQAPSP